MSDLLNQASLVYIPSGYKEDTAYTVIPTDGSGDLTFTRASDGTRVNSQGLVERVPWNLVQYSEDFSNAYWYKNQTTITTNATTAPNGTTTADKLEATTTSSNYINEQTGFNLDCTRYIYAKAGNYSQITILWNSYNNGMFATFNLSAGTVTYGGSGITASIESVGDGWYKCITSGSANYPYLVTLNGVNNSLIPVGSYIFIWGAQLNEGSTAKPYFPTTDRLNVPRLDYSNGCPSLLLEPQRTNYFEYSEDYSQIDWSKTSLTVVSNAATSPDGYQNADKIYPSATGGISYLYNISSTSSSVHTISAYVKADGKNIVWLYIEGGATYGTIYFDLSDQTIQVVGGSVSTPSGTITAVGSDWYRITFTTGSALAVTSGSGIGISNAKGNTYVTASGTNGVLVWGLQLEAGSYPTSYIPTTSASVTRVADAAYKTGISSLIGQTEGTIFVDLVYNGSEAQTGNIFSFDESTLGSVVIIRNSNGSVGAAVWDGSSKAVFNGGSMPIGQRTKIAYGYKSGSTALFVNGVQIGSDSGSTFTLPTISQIYLNSLTAYFAFRQDASFNQTVLFKTRLTNAELAALTTL